MRIHLTQYTFQSYSNFSVQFNCSVMSESLWPHGLQRARLPCPSSTPGACSNSCPSSWWYIQPSQPWSSPSPPAFSLSQHQGLFQWVSSSHWVLSYTKPKVQQSWRLQTHILCTSLLFSRQFHFNSKKSRKAKYNCYMSVQSISYDKL